MNSRPPGLKAGPAATRSPRVARQPGTETGCRAACRGVRCEGATKTVHRMPVPPTWAPVQGSCLRSREANPGRYRPGDHPPTRPCPFPRRIASAIRDQAWREALDTRARGRSFGPRPGDAVFISGPDTGAGWARSWERNDRHDHDSAAALGHTPITAGRVRPGIDG